MKRIGVATLAVLGLLVAYQARLRTTHAHPAVNPAQDAPTSAVSRPAAEPHWLPDDWPHGRNRIEPQLRGLDMAMIEIGYRTQELFFAGKDRNWPYAQYQIEKIELSLKLALERRPKRAASAKPFIEETIPLVKAAIRAAADENDASRYDEALERLRTDCMKCHVAENVPHFTVYYLKHRTSMISTGEPD